MSQEKSNDWGYSLFLLARAAIIVAFAVRFDVFTINIDDIETVKSAIALSALVIFLFIPEIWHAFFPKRK